MCVYLCLDRLPVHGLKISHRIPVVLNKNDLRHEGCVTASSTGGGSISPHRSSASIGISPHRSSASISVARKKISNMLEQVYQVYENGYCACVKVFTQHQDTHNSCILFTYSICSGQIQPKASYVRCEK
jgi:hypothetical protein